MEPNDLNTQNAISNGEGNTIQAQQADEQIIFTLTPDQAEIVRKAIRECIKDNGMQVDAYGAALHTICLEYTRNHPLGGNIQRANARMNNAG